jgi:hypothetical protein
MLGFIFSLTEKDGCQYLARMEETVKDKEASKL